MRKFFPRRSTGSGSSKRSELGRSSIDSAVSSQAGSHVAAVPVPVQPNCVLASSPRPGAEEVMQPLTTSPRVATGSSSEVPQQFTSLGDVQSALRRLGLESSNLIAAIDFTSSNDDSGRYCFNGYSLHDLTDRGGALNPYEAALKTISSTLAAFDEDNEIPVYGFGDAETEGWHVFSFFENDRPAHGFDELLSRYRTLVPFIKKAGPTCFAPIIKQAMKVVADSDFQYHVLLIIADGQVTRPLDIQPDENSLWEDLTIEAIHEACSYPLSIIMVGVGDGPWETMQTFETKLNGRFENFHFVNFTELQAQTRHVSQEQQEARFALEALRVLPNQYKYMKDHNMLGADRLRKPHPYDTPNPKPPPFVPDGITPVATRVYSSPAEIAQYLAQTTLGPTLSRIDSVESVHAFESSVQPPPAEPMPAIPSMCSEDDPVGPLRVGPAPIDAGFGTQTFHTGMLGASPMIPPEQGQGYGQAAGRTAANHFGTHPDSIMLHSGPMWGVHVPANAAPPHMEVPPPSSGRLPLPPPPQQQVVGSPPQSDFGAPESELGVCNPPYQQYSEQHNHNPNRVSHRHSGQHCRSFLNLSHSHSKKLGRSEPHVQQYSSSLSQYQRQMSTRLAVHTDPDEVGASPFDDPAGNGDQQDEYDDGQEQEEEHEEYQRIGVSPFQDEAPDAEVHMGNMEAVGGGGFHPPPVHEVVLPPQSPPAQQPAQASKQATPQQQQPAVPRAAVPAPSFGPEMDFLRSMFECPLTLDIMTDPVIAADCRTYERSVIEAYIAKKGVPWPSPITNEPIHDTTLRPNLDLRGRIAEWKQRTGYHSTVLLPLPVQPQP